MLVKIGFDLHFTGVLEPLQRYMRLMNADDKRLLCELSVQMCQFALNEASFLNYRPSQVAACATIIGINIYRRD